MNNAAENVKPSENKLTHYISSLKRDLEFMRIFRPVFFAMICAQITVALTMLVFTNVLTWPSRLYYSAKTPSLDSQNAQVAELLDKTMKKLNQQDREIAQRSERPPIEVEDQLSELTHSDIQ